MRLYLFGSPKLEQNGKTIKFDTRKALALFAYLVVTNESQSRDHLAALFWPDYEQSKARAALRRTLSTLKNGLGEGILDISREAISSIPNTDLNVDVLEFANLIEHSQNLNSYEKAAALYRGNFLAGFSLRDSSGFDDWQFYQQEHYRQNFAKVLERLVESHTEEKAYESALPYAKRWLELDMLSEGAHRWLIKLFTLTNQRSAALRQYRECVRILDEELGVSPLEETSSLYNQILENQFEVVDDLPVAIKPSSPKPISPQNLPFVGRTQELQKLTTFYGAVTSKGFFATVEGEAGIGKTRLINEFITDVTKRTKVFRLQCYEGETQLAYGPFIEGFRKAFLEERIAIPKELSFWLSELSRLLPELQSIYHDLPQPLSSNSPGAQSRFFEACTQVLLSILKHDPSGILIIEDLHLADDASLELLRYFVKRLDQKPVFILGTWRSEQVAYKQKLRQLLHDSDLSASIKLARLKKKEVHALIEASAITLAPELSQTLFDETQGIPFFLVAYLAELSQSTAEVSSIPKGVRALLTSRLESTNDLARQLLSTAAVIGRSFTFDTLRLSAGRSEEETVEGIETLLAQDLISELFAVSVDPSYDFRHALLRNLIYDDMSLARKRLLHRRVAEALVHPVNAQSKEVQTVKIAQHYQLAGKDDLAAQYFAKAGYQAKGLYANTEALAQFQSALALGYPANAEIQEAIGDLYTLQADYSSALIAFEKAAALSSHLDLAKLEHKLAELQGRLGAWEVSETHFMASLEELKQTGTAAFKSNLYVDWSRMHHQQSKWSSASDLAQAALGFAEESGEIEGIARAHNMLGVLAKSNGEVQEALFHFEKSLEQANLLEQQFVKVAVLNNLALVQASEDDLDKAVELMNSALEICSSQGDRHKEAALHNNLADLYHRFGLSEKSMSHLKAAVTLFASIGSHNQPEIWKLTTW